MRVRAAVAIVVLLLPVELSAQRQRLPIGGRRPGRPAPLPPQAPEVARQLAYVRSPLSVESYPLISYVDAPGYANGVASTWTSLGAGTRADYRVNRFVSATLDMTSSFVGGPAVTETAELGTRLRPERSERRYYPFVDLRVGYVYAFNRYNETLPGLGATQQSGYGRYSDGFGGVAGGGMEIALTRSLSLTTAASVLRNRMTTRGLFDPNSAPSHYSMTWYRYTLGIRYNSVKVVRPPGTDLR